MFYFILALHLFLSLVLIILVLLQQGKGASVGAVFGGSSNTLFGATGANTVLTKVTTGVAIAFMVTSVILVRIYATHVTARVGSNNPLEGSLLVGQQVEAAAPAADEAAKGDTVKAPVAKDQAPVAADSSAPVAAPQQNGSAKAAGENVPAADKPVEEKKPVDNK